MWRCSCDSTACSTCKNSSSKNEPYHKRRYNISNIILSGGHGGNTSRGAIPCPLSNAIRGCVSLSNAPAGHLPPQSNSWQNLSTCCSCKICRLSTDHVHPDLSLMVKIRGQKSTYGRRFKCPYSLSCPQQISAGD